MNVTTIDVTDRIDDLLTRSDQEQMISGENKQRTVSFGGSDRHVIRYDPETGKFWEEWHS